MNQLEMIQRLEERINMLEKQALELEQTMEYRDEFVTPKELAKIMKCSTDHIYKQIRKGYIKTAEGLGSLKRIPIDQFIVEKSWGENNKRILSLKKKTREKKRPKSIEDMRKMIW